MARIEITANIGTEPELKTFQGKNGEFAITSFSIAETPREKDKSGEWKDGETIWYRVSVMGKPAENAHANFHKGDRVIVIGTFKQSSYQAKDGSTKTGLEVKADSISLLPKAKANNVQNIANAFGSDSSWETSWN